MDRSFQEWFEYGVVSPPLGEFTDVSMSSSESCGVRVDGSVVCWGGWLDGLPEGEFTDVSFSGSSGCALRADGSLSCWPPSRWDRLAELGTAEVPEGEFTDVSVSKVANCAVRVSGEAVCWGDGRYGQLDVPDGEFSQVFAGARSCGLTADGELVCWGDIWSEGVMGSLPPGVYRSVSEGGGRLCAVDASGVLRCPSTYSLLAAKGIGGRDFEFKEVSVGNPGVCALIAGGDAVCWNTGVDVAGATRSGPFEQISLSGGVVCALRSDGEAQCWGQRRRSGPDGWIDDGPGGWERPAGEFTQVAAYGRSGTYACGIRADTAIGCWDHWGRGGWAAGGPMGWMAAKPDRAGFVAVAVAETRACALEAGGEVVCWGASEDDAAADGAWSPPGGFTQITATDQDGRGRFCGLRADASLLCWSGPGELTAHSVEWSRLGTGGCGIRPDGQIECRAHEYRDESPHGTGPLARAAIGPQHNCGIRRADSSIACWSKHSGLPAQAPPGAYTDIEASTYSGFCAIAADASLACWDNNIHIYSPQQREKRQILLDPPDGQFTKVAVGHVHACAIRADKTLACWGPQGGWSTTEDMVWED